MVKLKNSKAYSRWRNWLYRRRALERLGGRCARCGITDLRVLQISHRNGDGRLERGGRQSGGRYQKIALGKRDVNDLELLCANCHIIYEHEMGFRRVPEKPTNSITETSSTSASKEEVQV
jgi:hypothetical protein